MAGNAVCDPFRDLVDRVLRKMGVAGRRLDIVVAEQLADHRKGLAKRERPGRKAVSEVMQPHVLQIGTGPDDAPGTVEAAPEAPVAVAAWKHPGAVVPTR